MLNTPEEIKTTVSHSYSLKFLSAQLSHHGALQKPKIEIRSAVNTEKENLL